MAFAYSVVIALAEARHPQKVWIMNIVWPVNALYLSVFALWAYFRASRSRMALVFFKRFPGPHLNASEATYWPTMQIAKVCGFITSLPVNWFLVKSVWKEAMG